MSLAGRTAPPESHGLREAFQWLPKPYRRRGIITVVLLFLAGLAEGIGVIALLPILQVADSEGTDAAGITRTIINIVESTGLRATVGVLLAILVLGLSLKAGLFLLAMREASYIGADLAQELRLDLVEGLAKANWQFFVQEQAGRLTNAISAEAARSAEMFVSVCYMLTHGLQALVYLVLSAFVSLQVTIAAFLGGALVLFVFSFFVRVARDAGNQQALLLSSLTGRLADAVGIMKPLKAMNRERESLPVLLGEVIKINQFQKREMLSRTALPALQEPIIGLLLAMGLYAALRGTQLDLTRLLFMAVLFQRIVTRTATAQSWYQQVRAMEATFWQLRATIERAADATESSTGWKTVTLRREISLRGVSTSYGTKRVLHDFSMDIPVGQLTTLTGASGSGKTTILDLVCGLMSPDQGEILVDGVMLQEIDMAWWRSNIGYVPQESVLLHESVAANIRLGDTTITDQDIEESLRIVEAWEFVQELPQGIKAIVGEKGSSLSGGQRQRLSLARALVRRPHLLILDEVTTALDPETERQFCQSIDALRGRTTILAVSHQLAFARIADSVVRVGS